MASIRADEWQRRWIIIELKHSHESNLYYALRDNIEPLRSRAFQRHQCHRKWCNIRSIRDHLFHPVIIHQHTGHKKTRTPFNSVGSKAFVLMIPPSMIMRSAPVPGIDNEARSNPAFFIATPTALKTYRKYTNSGFILIKNVTINPKNKYLWIIIKYTCSTSQFAHGWAL